jgi:hypothetical protein
LLLKKSVDISAVERQANILRPYNSSGEYNFMRGGGLTIGMKTFSLTAFASVRKIDGTSLTDTSQVDGDFVTAIANSGYHRTATEVAKKNAETQFSWGGNISYTKDNFHVGLNGIAFSYSIPIKRVIYPYNQFAIQGSHWSNYSVDYSYTYRNFHFFGEAAAAQNGSKALLAGMLASLDARVDASVVYRNIGKSYQTLYGNAFTENTLPTNENGLFTGISIKPFSFLKVDAYADIYSFPWLRYRVDAPSHGSDYLVQLTYAPNKAINFYSLFKVKNKAINIAGADLPARQVSETPKQNWRMQLSYNIDRHFTYRQRIELVWFDIGEKERSQQGFLLYGELAYKAEVPRLSLNFRTQYFETGGFESRIYSYESDLLYSYSIPQFDGKGFRYYFNAAYDVNRKMTIWCRWGQTIYQDQQSIGNGLDRIEGNKKSEIKLQVLYAF